MDEELMHYGVLGMKWGVRRTPEQLGHKPKVSSTSSGANKQKNKAAKSKSKGVADMTDEELRQRIQRLNMEEQYSNLAARAKERNTSTLRKLASNALESLGRKSFEYAVQYAVDKIFSKDDPDAELKKEVDRLRLEDQKADYLDKKKKRTNPKSDVDVLKWKDADVNTMDADTIQAVARYYANAKLITDRRNELSGGS